MVCTQKLGGKIAAQQEYYIKVHHPLSIVFHSGTHFSPFCMTGAIFFWEISHLAKT
jgi:hypothetical protein